MYLIYNIIVAIVVKTPPANAGDVRDESSIPGLGRSPGGGHGNPLQYSCLENPMDRGPGGLQSTELQRLSMHMPHIVDLQYYVNFRYTA